MMQPSLFDYVPPAILGDRDGSTFDATRDRKRLNKQAQDVFNLMKDGEWRDLSHIALVTDHPEASVSARIRDLRKPKFGGYTVERRRLDGGLFVYRLVIA